MEDTPIQNRLTLHTVDEHGNPHVFTYDNLTCTLYDESNERVVNDTFNKYIDSIQKDMHKHREKCDHDLNTKHKNPTHIRISLGDKCNYRCKYCKQEHHDTRDPYSTEELDKFIELFSKNLEVTDVDQIQLWGGEPLIYKKTILYLTKKFKELYPDVGVFALSNGSLWTKEFVDECIEVGLMLGLSHDGPGQCYRTTDPLEEGTISREAILYYWNYVRENPTNTFSILLTLTDKNSVDFIATEEYFVNIFGKDIMYRVNFLPLMIDNADQHGCQYDTASTEGTPGISFKVLSYLMSRHMEPCGFTTQTMEFAKLFTRKKFRVCENQVSCFIASPVSIVLDLYGNIIPCQNYTATSTIRGMSANMGHVSDIDNLIYPKYIKLKDKATKCLSCPVVAMCMGGCPLNEQPYLSEECKSNFVLYMGMFAYVVFLMTGTLLTSIDGEFSCKSI